MDFEEARKSYDTLILKLRNGKISQDEFNKLVNELRVLDASGRWWQPDPATGKWLSWNGTRWEPNNPPATGLSTKKVTKPTSPEVTVKKPPPRSVKESSSQFMDLKSLRETRHTTNWKNRSQKYWDLFAVLCGVAIAILWILYTGVPASSEGFDLLSPALMIVMPVVLVLFRGQIDSFLTPIQPFRKKLSPMLLMGISIAIPFLTAVILYDFLGISEYNLMHWNLVIGTFLAYAISRDPEPGIVKRTGNNTKVNLLLFFLLLMVICVTPVVADDCLRDPLNAKDCARTGLIAQLLAAAPASALGNLLNVPSFARRVYSPDAVRDLPGDLSKADSYESETGLSWEEQNEKEWQESLEKRRTGYIQQEDGSWIPQEQDYNWNHNRLLNKLSEIVIQLNELHLYVHKLTYQSLIQEFCPYKV
ncbi:MAG: hypothetical protein MUF37_08385 [Methanoregulaceae archaeon]|nr:hypothetical protein [Methanoregulaceae archaeon]